MLVTDKGKTKPMSIVTKDGGKTWDYLPLKEPPISFFFLNETGGWMVTADGIWFTDEAGRSWRKLSKPDNVLRVCFLTPQHGFRGGRGEDVPRDQRWRRHLELPSAGDRAGHH